VAVRIGPGAPKEENMKVIISIIGGHTCTDEVEQIAKNLGKNLAKVVDFIVCGGLSGTMEAVCNGFKQGGGTTIGILPSYNKNEANHYIDIVIPTGLGLARNVLVVQAGDVVVALPGSHGTLSEIAYCLQFNKPVISLNSWEIKGVIKVNTVEAAIKEIKKITKGTTK
jgi:uncharacterized protein (TIGR00725 family)